MAIEIKNQEIFGKVIADAMAAINAKPLTTWEATRWINAVGKAVAKLEDLSYQFEWMKEEGHLLVWSDSNEIYEANGTCQCKAFVEFGYPCWHRALAKLIKNYLIEETNQVLASEIIEEKTDISKAPYLKNGTGAKPVKYGNIRI